MSVDANTLRKLAALNLSGEQLSGVLGILADGVEADEARRAAQRDRTRRARLKQRDNRVTVTAQARDMHSDDTHASVTHVEDKTSNSEIEPQQKERNALTREFEQTFWPEYPNKTGKPKALASFVAARKRASLDAIVVGLRRYVAGKPVDRAWLNPATFLNQDRWADEPAPAARAGPSPPRRGLGDVFGELGDFLDGQGHGSGDDQTPQGVVLRLPQRAAQ